MHEDRLGDDHNGDGRVKRLSALRDKVREIARTEYADDPEWGESCRAVERVQHMDVTRSQITDHRAPGYTAVLPWSLHPHMHCMCIAEHTSSKASIVMSNTELAGVRPKDFLAIRS